MDPYQSVLYRNTGDKKEGVQLPLLYQEQKDCCGCTACLSICPNHAITMEENWKGFLYPVVDASACIGCGQCMRACAFQKAMKETDSLERNPVFETLVSVVQLKDTEELMRSSSGGAFTALSNVILEEKGAIACSIYSSKTHTLSFEICTTEEKRNEARGSKYFQSDMGTVFRASRDWIRENPTRPFLFIGTGCQADGFRTFMELQEKKSPGLTENLYTADIICHGVPSQKMWREYIHALEAAHHAVTERISFKDKRNGWFSPSAIAVMGGKEVSMDSYVRTFNAHCMLRESCHSCPYATTRRRVDLTIGDYWGVKKYHPELMDERGLSLVLTHTPKGKKLLDMAVPQMEVHAITLEESLQPRLQYPTAQAEYRDQFWQDYQNHGMSYVIHRYGEDSFAKRVRGKLSRMIHKLTE